VDGTIEADSEASALSRLGEEGVFPVAIGEVGQRAGSPSAGAARRISVRTLAYTTQQLADLLGGGLPLLTALTLLAKQTEQRTLGPVIEALAEAVRDGHAFSDALADFPRIFPPLYRSMVKAGEVSGSLEQALSRLAELGEHEAELRSRVLTASAYPLFVLVVAVGMTVFLMAYVVPKLSLVFLETGQVLPLPTRGLLAASRLFTQWWVVLALGLAGGVRLAQWWYATPVGKALVDRVLIGIPAVGELVKRLETARFARNLGTMVGQGVPILQALEVAATNVANASLRKALTAVQQAVRDGASLAAALSDTRRFAVFVSNMVAVGEESGTVDAALLKVAVSYEREADRTLRTLTTVLEPLLLLLVGGIVLFIVLAMLLPVFQIGLTIQ
jgi:type II secretory pathway component PulF